MVAVGIAAGVIAISACWSAGAADADPSATIVLEQNSGSIGLGSDTGKGKLFLKDGSVYAVTMDRYSLLGLGVANATSTGKVYNLVNVTDLSGEYSGIGHSASFWKGDGKSTLKNDVNNVRIELVSKLSGVIAEIGPHSAVLRLGDRLKGPDAPPPVAAAPAPVPVKAAPVPVALPKPTNYTLYFGFDKSRVNLANSGVLDSILADWKEKGATFRVVGHADMVGSAKYNMRLSQERANAVMQMLIKKGVPESNVVAVGVGQKDLAVQTGAGKRLRENRRVTLTVLTNK